MLSLLQISRMQTSNKLSASVLFYTVLISQIYVIIELQAFMYAKLMWHLWCCSQWTDLLAALQAKTCAKTYLIIDCLQLILAWICTFSCLDRTLCNLCFQLSFERELRYAFIDIYYQHQMLFRCFTKTFRSFQKIVKIRERLGLCSCKSPYPGLL